MSIGIDEPSSLSGFTIRELLIEAAGTATGEEDLGVAASAFEMLDLFEADGAPSLSAAQVETYTNIIRLASDYESTVSAGEPDEYATEQEHRSFALASNAEALIHAVRWLGGK